jgi:succinate-semialdehyde dehydrogenase/glutarate-semialdehyde dehydrogenase
LLADFSASLQSARDEIASLVLQEVGKPPAESVGEVDYAVSFIDHYIELLDQVSFQESVLQGQRTDALPAGIAFLICAFNDPVAGLTRKIAPAVAAGCPVMIKPSPLGMMTGLAVVKHLEAAAARVAPGGAAVLASDDPALIGRAMAHPGVAVVSFTGSTQVGRKVAETAGRGLSRCVLELGGNCPFVVLPDADIDKAASDLVVRKRKAAGQACSAVNRVFVHRDVYASFRDKVLAGMEAARSGPATAPDVEMGPVRTGESVRRLDALVERGAALGERAIATGARNEDGPFLFPLTILETEDDGRSILDHEEAFGPLLSLRPFSDFDRLTRQLLAERHALAAYIYGEDPQRLAHFCEQARFGSVGVNTTGIQGANVPTGGFGEAGFGREGGHHGLREFLATRNLRMLADQTFRGGT